MPIPDFQTLMRPFLQLLSDRKPRHINDILEHLSNEYNLTPDERQSMLPSGTDFTMRNRVGWTRTYLKKAGLIDSPSRAMFAINDTGLDVLKNAKTINVAFLRTLPAFQEWQKTYASKEAIAPVDGGPTIGTPSGTVSEQTPTELMADCLWAVA
jgi:restriction system protein